MTDRHYYKQLYAHNPEDGEIGDCWRTCIANLLGLKPQQVPHFMKLHWGKDGADSTAARAATNEWLKQFNLQMMSINLTADSSIPHVGPSPYIIEGYGTGDCAHACLGHGNFEILHNPAAEGEGLAPITADGGPPYYWLTWLVPINLAAMTYLPYEVRQKCAIVTTTATRKGNLSAEPGAYR